MASLIKSVRLAKQKAPKPPDEYALLDSSWYERTKNSAAWGDLPEQIREGIRIQLVEKIRQNEGWDAPSSEVIYHGSPSELDEIKAIPHYLADDKPVVFGTPSRSMALAFLGDRWRDEDLDLGSFEGSEGRGPLHLREQYPGALEKIYSGKQGYLYHMDPEGFVYQPNLMRSERINFGQPKLMQVEHVPDVLRALEDSDIQLIRHGELEG